MVEHGEKSQRMWSFGQAGRDVRLSCGDLSDRERVLIGLDLLYDELTDNNLTSSLMDALEEVETAESDS